MWTSADFLKDSWIGSDAPTDDYLIGIWLGKAEREIRYRIPDIQARIDAEADQTPASEDLLQAAQDVVVAMVTRVFRNPEGARQKQWTTGPFSESMTVGGAEPGSLYLTDDELAKLQGAQSGGAFTISMIPATSPFSPDYVAPLS